MSGTPLTDAINALTTYSNTVTGASDTTLSEAVATLASGYGGGGGSDPWHLKSNDLGFNIGSTSYENATHPACAYVNSTTATNTRRCALAFDGTATVEFKGSNSSYSSTNMYLIPIPQTATKVTIKIDRTMQISVYEFVEESGVITGGVNSYGWEDITANTSKENTLSSGTSYLALNFRVNSSNSNFAYNTIPRRLSVDFS